jgi:toxin ParE1/3/4
MGSRQVNGRTTDEVASGIGHAVGSNTVYYRIVSDDVVNVVRILHQRMDVDRNLE